MTRPAWSTLAIAGFDDTSEVPSAAPVTSLVAPSGKVPVTVSCVAAPSPSSEAVPGATVRDEGPGSRGPNGIGGTTVSTLGTTTNQSDWPPRVVKPSVQLRRARTRAPLAETDGTAQLASASTWTDWLRICTLLSSSGSTPT